jgi:hypothetical protein
MMYRRPQESSPKGLRFSTGGPRRGRWGRVGEVERAQRPGAEVAVQKAAVGVAEAGITDNVAADDRAAASTSGGIFVSRRARARVGRVRSGRISALGIGSC